MINLWEDNIHLVYVQASILVDIKNLLEDLANAKI